MLPGSLLSSAISEVMSKDILWALTIDVPWFLNSAMQVCQLRSLLSRLCIRLLISPRPSRDRFAMVASALLTSSGDCAFWATSDSRLMFVVMPPMPS